jgi:hypothetical protein
MKRTVDVLDVSDFRFSGGTSASIAEEIVAQAQAGWTTGLLHLNGPLVARTTAINAKIRELVVGNKAQLLVGREPVGARVTVIRHPTVFQHAAEQLPPIETEQVLLIANSTLISPDGSAEFDPRRITGMVRDRFGVSPLWAPLSPLIRHQLLRSAPGLEFAPDDWVNVIDADRWDSGHRAPLGDRPVIGRHSRDVAAKWPTTRSELEAIYPTDGSAIVHVLGGAGPARVVLDRPLPESWRVWNFGTLEPSQFLRDLDVYVYYTDTRWVEAFGRNVLEAMAAGVPVVLPRRLEPIFGDAAHYAQPTGVQGVVRSLHRDAELWRRTSRHALQTVRERFSPDVHRARLQALTGLEPKQAGLSSAAAPPGRPMPTDKPEGNSETPRPRLLLISSNGTGMGHLMRLMAYGRRATDFEPHVLSLSQGVGAVGALGMPFEYVPSAGALGMSPSGWQPIFTERVGAALDRIRPSVVVFDGTWPYAGIEVLRGSHPEPAWVWSRRGMWRADRGGEQLERSIWFDEILEPGDFASAADTGPTAKAPSVRVPPVTLLDDADLLSEDEARRDLGLPVDGPLALVCFSGGDVDDVTSDTAAAITACRRLGLQICVTRSVVSPHVHLPDDVHVINPIPLAKYQRAFDVAISAAGYNSFHELLRFGTPTLFVPKRNSSLDDQDRRARWAADQGWSRYATRVTETETVDALTDLLDHGKDMIAKLAQVDPGNGAFHAAKLVSDIHVGRAS